MPDSSNIIVISPDASSWINNTIYYEDYNSNNLQAFGYKFPSNFIIKQIQIFEGYSISPYSEVIYITMRVLVGTSERLYYMRYNSPIIGGVLTNKINSDFILFPNPTKDNLIISINNTQFTIKNVSILDFAGKQVKSINTKGQSKNYVVNIEDLPAGLYILKVTGDKGTEVTKFVKE